MVEVFNVKIQEIEGLETQNLETGLEEELQIVDHGSKILASIFLVQRQIFHKIKNKISNSEISKDTENIQRVQEETLRPILPSLN